jgi:hypothetical protein
MNEKAITQRCYRDSAKQRERERERTIHRVANETEKAEGRRETVPSASSAQSDLIVVSDPFRASPWMTVVTCLNV